MVEKERKFILKGYPDNNVVKKLDICSIEQGYIILADDRHLRIRIVDRHRAFMACKIMKSDTTRLEYEYEIPISDGYELLHSTEYRLQKTRYSTIHKGNQVDIDVYPDGMKVVEIEYEDELVDIPDYCGEEVTGNDKYSNIAIAIKNAEKTWDEN